ncbi:flagellar hook-basal body complex protein FliE [Marivibrio halodurans]|uniref:Flagellar hook-basal body complex protein FliE n=1 Tax=Marivibrio halodurans TaxID=2039722 RepID=A0A8J7SLQ8_9PROT|nr:flagellar hook-basal body complex protein FliE [Marivibrio halodurans]MBP5857013.1 flagellar hook-basal body complex protein FliE [Marivibrio halodurans]
MAIDPSNAAAAYRNAAAGNPFGVKPGASPTDIGAAMGGEETTPGSRFVDLVRTAAQDTIDSNREAERLGMEGVAGQANLTEVVTAVADAEATLQTVVAVRDRIISAYQEILRMPI